MSDKYIVASERTITDVKWGNAALWEFLLWIVLWYQHKHPVDPLKTSVWSKCEPIA
jgi:hypothetical protein